MLDDKLHSETPMHFGLNRYMNRSWEVITVNNNVARIKKVVTYNDIRVKKNIHIPLCENITECWEVDTSKKKVMSIRRMA